MGRFKRYDYNQGMFIPVFLEEQLMPGTLEYAIHSLVEKHIDISVFENKYSNDGTGRLAYDPKVLLKVVLLGYSRGLISSRKIEQACKENIVFMAMSCGQYPDHSTIAAFVSGMKEEIMPLFRNILLVCEEMNLLGGTFFALDGCKLPSNASKAWSGTVDDLKNKKDKFEEKVRQMIREQEDEDRKGESTDNHDKQIEKLNRQAERIGKWLNENEPKAGAKRELKSNVTDNESAKMLTSHGAVQGYNSQVMVDAKHQVIVHAEVFGNGQDHGHVPPMIDGARDTMEQLGHSFEGTTLTADCNYHSNVNIQKCIDEKIDAYIPDLGFRTRDPKFSNRERHGQKARKCFALEDYQYDKDKDQYICPNGQTLRMAVKRHVAANTAYRMYRAQDCSSCPMKAKCIYKNGRGPKTLMVPLGADGINLSKMMVEKIESEQGRKIYPQRIAIVEPVFANIRTNKGLDRFTLRGKIKVNIQWLLYCMVHNMEKIANYGFAYC